MLSQVPGNGTLPLTQASHLFTFLTVIATSADAPAPADLAEDLLRRYSAMPAELLLRSHEEEWRGLRAAGFSLQGPGELPAIVDSAWHYLLAAVREDSADGLLG